MIRRSAVVVLAAGVWLLLAAAPALADAAGPTNYESTVLGVDPEIDGVEFDVVGGDSFLRASVAAGHELLVPGYSGEAYIRVDRDGSVWVNEASPSAYLNDDRYGEAEIPEGVTADSAPRWRQVGDDGRYAWHDHRIHWMSTNTPPAVSGERRQVVFPWTLAVLVDGAEVTLDGELVWLPSRSPALPLMIGSVALLPLAVPRRMRPRAAVGLAAAAAIAAVVITLSQAGETPPSARAFPAVVVLPLLALAAALWTLADRPLLSFSPAYVLLLAGLALAAWAFATIEVLSAPIVPSVLPTPVERVTVSAVLWVGGAVVLTALSRIVADARGVD
jgi:hypothetical protein